MPGSSVLGIFQVIVLEWVAISFSNVWKWKVKVKSLSGVRLLVTPWTAPTRQLCPWDFPGKSTRVGCHCLLYSDCVDHNKLWKILKEVGIPDHLTRLLRNLYAVQEASVRTGHGTTDWFQIGKGVHQGLYCHPAYLTSMQSTSWETLAGWSTSWNPDCREKYQ